MTDTIAPEQAPPLDTVATTERLRELVIAAVRKRGKEQGAYLLPGTRVAITCSLAGVFTFTLTHYDAVNTNKTWHQALKCLPKEHQQKWPKPSRSTEDSGAWTWAIEYRPPPPALKRS